MKQNLSQTLGRIFLLGFLLAFALGLNYLNAWTAPTQAPPNGNVPAPLNTGTGVQSKSGGLQMSSLDIIGANGASAVGGQFSFWSGAIVNPAYTIDMGDLDPGANNGIRFPDDTVQTTAASGGMGKLFLAIDQRAAGTGGGTCTTGVANTHTLNTEVVDDIGVTLSGNQFTLPAGTYYIEASAPAYMVSTHKAALYNVTSGSVAIYGTSEMANNGPNAHTASLIRGKFTIASPTTYSIQHRCQSTVATTGLGLPGVGLGGWPEVYTVVSAWKLD